MNTLTRLQRIADNIRTAVENEGGLEIELSKARIKSLLRIAGQIDDIVAEQRSDIVAEQEALKEAEEAKRAEAVREVLALIDRNGLTLKEIKAVRPRKGQPVANSAEIRAWAIDSGLDINPLGIIPKKIRAAYEEAHA